MLTPDLHSWAFIHQECKTSVLLNKTYVLYLPMTWLLLIHQIPAKPTYFRAKIWRRLQQVGAVPIKQAVYVMPDSEQSYEDLSWIAKEIIESGGESVLLNGELLEGLTDNQTIALFEKARRTDYEKILTEAREVMDSYHAQELSDVLFSDCKAALTRLNKSFATCVAIDFFPVAEQSQLEAFLADMETIFRQSSANDSVHVTKIDDLPSKIWVTKRNVYVDRMASAWFIKRFINSDAHFKFIKESRYQPEKNEVRFDMIEAEYTHQGDLCTFEVLVQRFCASDKGLQQIAKIIHDIDLKDESFGLPETAGIHVLFDSIVSTNNDDLQRIEQASSILDGLLVHFTNKNN